MAETTIRGPAVSLGPLMGSGGAEPYDGPDISYQGGALIDPRYSPANKDGMNAGRIPAFLSSPYVVMVDNVPAATTTANLAALANAVSGTAMALVTTAAGGSAAGVASVAQVPLLLPGASAPIQVLAQDFGFTTGTTVAGNKTVTVPDSTLFQVGQWIVIGGAGNSGNTASLITQVQTLATATTITVSVAPTGALTYAPIGNANFYGAWPAQGVPNAVNPYVNGGVAALFNPVEVLARAVSITGVSGGAGGAFLVKGYDIYGVAMSETITVGAGAVTKYGQKAFKYVVSITPQFSDAHNYSAGNSDTFGCALRTDKWEYVQIFWNASFATTATGWVQALQPGSGPSTATTGDVRGTVQVGSKGNGSALATIGANADGVKRLAIMMSVPLYNLVNATPVNSTPMFGLAQA